MSIEPTIAVTTGSTTTVSIHRMFSTISQPVQRSTESNSRSWLTQNRAMITKLSTNAKIWSPWSPRNVAVSTPSFAASETLSSSGRISSVIAIATTASVKNFNRSALSSPVDSAMRGIYRQARSDGHRQRQREVVRPGRSTSARAGGRRRRARARCRRAGTWPRSRCASARPPRRTTSRSRAATCTRWRVDGLQPHLDPLVLGVPDRAVLEGLGLEVGAQLTVEDGQHVLVERGRDALRCRRTPRPGAPAP